VSGREGCNRALSFILQEILFCKSFVRSEPGKVVILRKRIAGLSRSTLERFVLRARHVVHLRETVNVLVTSSAELRSLNRQFRGADKATDVLSFPSPPVKLGKSRRVAGEVAISADIARENARQLGHSVADEVKILALHGVLHLAGFDHERDNGEMARKESRLRRQLKLQVGLIERMQPRDRLHHGKRRTA
jgi:probable rRNA maturation factor